MKIAVVSSGNSIHVKKIINALTERGHEITFYTMSNHQRILGDIDKKVKIVLLPFSGKLGYYLNCFSLKRYLKKGEFDLVNTHYASGYGTLARLAAVHPLALAVFGTDVYEYPYQSGFNMRTIIKNLDNADVITSTSNVMVEATRKFYNTNRHIYVTPFGVDINRFKPAIEKKDSTCFTFGIVKKIEPQYGIEVLVRAYKLFYDAHPMVNSKLVIYGCGTFEIKCKELVKELGIEDKVIFGGFIKNELVPTVLSQMDVACFPSDSESFGVAAVEAMACGVPVITSDASGFLEVVEDGITGIIVSKKSIESLAKAMDRMYKMPASERAQMGMAGVKRVRELYNFDKNIDTYFEAILNCVDSKNK